MRINWVVWATAMFYVLLETSHFGGFRRLHYQNDTEVLCDGIALLIFALAFVVRKGER